MACIGGDSLQSPHGEEREARLEPLGIQTAISGDRLVLRDGLRLPQDEARDALDVDTLFIDLDDASLVLLAVSGGPDSMALLLLASRWARRRSPPILHVATVDHSLRAASASECTMVASAAAALGLPHTTLPWRGPKPSTRIQERARDARYALLAAHARAIGATHVLTAHHADDQAETVLLRLGRGSGVGGLAGMRRETAFGSDLTLVRPLLAHSKAELVALCRSEGVGFVEDPSNADPVYARARLRGQGAARAALGLDAPTLTRLARRMARADAALEAEATRVEGGLSFEPTSGGLKVSLRPMVEAQPEILLRVLRRTIERVAETQALRLDRLESLTDAVAEALRAGYGHRATLGGARLVLGCDTMLAVTREPPRRRGRRLAEG